MRKLVVSVYNILIKVFFPKVAQTKGTGTPITLKYLFFQKILGFNRKVYWPVHFTSIITGYKNIHAGIDVSPGYMPGCYIQGIGKISIGDYTQISANVGIITANHDIYDNSRHIVKSVDIGKYCWIGMNVMILPGVKLGDNIIVGAGSVVTKSYEEGNCILAGNPAKIIKKLNKDEFVHYKNKYEYKGFIKAKDFDNYRKRKLNF
ncbi:acyltransferase [Tenacibaculum ovolyticum]|uniref:acyltransferase n=1 Tax=Tenacibaculum ovolyticum TaxID=104270 RepID=UPI003BAC2E5E